MKCMYAQTRPRFILSSEGVFGGMEFEPMLTPREKSPLPKMSPEEDRTCSYLILTWFVCTYSVGYFCPESPAAGSWYGDR